MIKIENIKNKYAKNNENEFSLQHSEYNIFHVLEVSAKEVIMCRFLADLLNPEGMHGCGILFLKSFFAGILREKKVSDTLLAHTDVIREFVTEDDRRIDIVIRNARFFIPIEVKIYAGEQEGQCWDYYEYAKKHDKNTKLVYLTRFGTVPSEYSRKEKNGTGILLPEKILCISWEQDICCWLTELLPDMREVLRPAVMQYIDAVRRIADGKRDNDMKKSMEIVYESADYFAAGVQIEKVMKEAKLKLIRLVFDDFRTEMDRIAFKYNLEPEKAAGYYSYEDDSHKKFYDCYSTYPGLNYIVKHAKFQKDSLQLWFRIEVEHNLFAGFCLYDTEAKGKDSNAKGYQVNEITDELIKETARYLDRDIILPEDWWFAWCYSNGRRQIDDYEDVPNFKEMNTCAVQLADWEKRHIFIENAVKNFEEHLLRYLTAAE